MSISLSKTIRVLDLAVHLFEESHIQKMDAFTDEDAETLFTQGATSLRSISFTVWFIILRFIRILTSILRR